jgi:hypothetical protein
MDYIDYLGIVALLKAVLLVKAVLWPDELRGTVHAHHPSTLDALTARNFASLMTPYIRRFHSLKQSRKRGPDGMLNLMGNLFFQSII